MNRQLPPGQRRRRDFPRFGLNWFAHRFPKVVDRIEIEIAGDVAATVMVSDQLPTLPRVEQTSDFHCVTTWSQQSLRWGGVRFKDFYERMVKPDANPDSNATFVVIKGQDGYCNSMALEDLLADDVLLADTLNGEPLPMEHGAPLRLVAPAHYGYKNVKHLHRIEFWRDDRNYSFPGPGLLEHRRARVALEERSGTMPSWSCRLVYPPLVGFTAWMFRVGAAWYHRKRGMPSD